MALKKYANEHPRNKKLSKDKTKKLAKAKLKPSKWLIEEYNANVKEGYKGSRTQISINKIYKDFWMLKIMETRQLMKRLCKK